MNLCDICANLTAESITEDETCKLQDWDRMETLANKDCESCAGCRFFWSIISSYNVKTTDNQYSWGTIGFIDPHTKRHWSNIQTFAMEDCSGCESLLAIITEKNRFRADSWEDWDGCDEDDQDADPQVEGGDAEELARTDCLGCQALLSEIKTKAVCIVRYKAGRAKSGLAMIVDGYESTRAVEFLLELCSHIDFEFAPWVDDLDSIESSKSDTQAEMVYNRLIRQDPDMTLPMMWMHNCESHAACRAPVDLPLPTRVIEVGTIVNPIVRLCVTNGRYGRYIALSHCWGTSKMVTTTTQTVDQFQQSIVFDTLPKNFRDAITITRELGYAYIWIDSLCIIQDSPEDWAHESALMGFFYTQAIMTIAAMAAKDSAGGILRQRNAAHSHHIGPQKSLVLRQKPVAWDHVYNLPLSRRAWTLQEQHLSQRTLYFTEDQMFWECNQAVYAESCRRVESVSGSAQKQRIEGLSTMADLHIQGLLSSDGDLQATNMRYAAWYNLVRDFTRRELTYVSDKLPAISGLAQVIGDTDRRLKHGDYIAGLWKSDLLRGLKWMTGYFGRDNDTRNPMALKKNPEYTGPSWSWAAYEGPVSYFSTCELESRGLAHEIQSYEETSLIDELDIHDEVEANYHQQRKGSQSLTWPKKYRTYLIKCHIELASPHNYGQVSPGCYVILSGLCRDAFVHSDSDTTILSNPRIPETVFLDVEADGWESKKRHVWYWDKPQDADIQLKQCTILQITANTKSGGIFSLILSRIDHGDAFERVGFTNIGRGLVWEWGGEPMGWNSNDWSRRELKLV